MLPEVIMFKYCFIDFPSMQKSSRIEGLLSLAEDIVKKFEKERLNILTLFIWVFALSFTRTWVEAYLFNYSYAELSYKYIFNYAHIIFFYFAAYLMGVVVLKFFSKEKLMKVANLSAWGFTVILLPPFLDKFVFHTTTYRYVASIQQFIEGYTSFFLRLGNVGGYGLFVEIVTILLLSSIYVFNKRKSIPIAVAHFFVLYTLILIIGTPRLDPILAMWSPEAENLVLPGHTKVAAGLLQPVFFLHFLIICIILTLIAGELSKRGFVFRFLKTVRLPQVAHGILMVIIGIIVAGHLNINLMNLSDPLQTGDIGMAGLSIFLVVFLWVYTAIINDIYDIEIDKFTNRDRIVVSGILTKKQALHIAAICAIIAVWLSIMLSVHAFILALIALVMGTIYSVPPVRFRNTVFSTTFIGIGSAIAYFIGYMTPRYIQVGMMPPFEFVKILPPSITQEGIEIGILIAILLSIGPLVTDLKDYESEKKLGIRNIYTIYGKEKGVTIVSILLFFSFISLIILFHTPQDIVIFLVFGLAASILFKKYEITKGIFLLYFPVVVYCVARWVGLI